jgi:hypothetical protein
MTGNVLTVAVGIAGVAASVVCSVGAFRWGTKQADRQKAELVDETNRQTAELSLEIDRVRRVLATFVRNVETSRTISRRGRRATRGDRAGGTSDVDVEPAGTIELLARASLGALLDARGEVRVQRLLDETAATLGASSQAETIAALQHLREIGVVQWDGRTDLTDVQSVRVLSPGMRGRTVKAASGAVNL